MSFFFDLDEHVLAHFGTRQHKSIGALSCPVEGASRRSGFKVCGDFVKKDVVQPMTENPRVTSKNACQSRSDRSALRLASKVASAARLAATA